MGRWTRFVIRNRGRILLAWLAIAATGVVLAAGLDDVLSNEFGVPGSEADRGAELLSDELGVSLDGGFVLVFEGQGAARASVASLQDAARRAAAQLDGGRAQRLQRPSPDLAFVAVTSPLDGDDAADRTDAVRDAVGKQQGWKTYVSGPAAITNDIAPLLDEDLAKSEAIALPIVLAILIFTLGTAVSAVLPLLFAAVTIPTSLGLVWLLAHALDVTDYVTNIVTLVGLAIAVDYSMLIVLRFREELAAGDDPHDALERTMQTAGRATVLSGATVAIGLALLGVINQPFLRSLGLGGLTVPLVSILASLTLLPALLATLGTRVERGRLVSRAALAARSQPSAAWRRIASAATRYPLRCALAALVVLLALAAPVAQLELTAGFSGGGDNRDLGSDTEATAGLRVLERRIGAGVLAPNYVIASAGLNAAQAGRLTARLEADPGIAPGSVEQLAGGPPALIAAAGRTDTGSQQARDLVDRIRDRHVPGAGLDARAAPLTGQPALASDFIDRLSDVFPLLVAAVLLVSYVLLLRAFRSLLLPFKALLMNLLSVAAAYGVLVLVFQEGLGEPFGLQHVPEIQAWVPVILFAIMFGLSMDYEVFLISRVREEHGAGHDTEQAVIRGLAGSGRVISSAAAVMVVTFLSFAAGRFAGLQMFGVGLATAVLLDATLIRGLLFPATMRLLGPWNWYLPRALRRLP